MNEFVDWVANNKAKAYTSFAVGAALAILCASMIWGAIAGISALAGDDYVTVKIDNNCITEKGLVRSNAGSRCFEDGQPHPLLPNGATITTASNNTPSAPAPKKAAPVYDPPCGPGSNAHVCTEQITEKSRVSGRIHTVTYHGEGSAEADLDHVQPDYTEVEYDPCDGDDCEYAQVKFCGNLLDNFEPGKMLNMVVKDSNLTDYDQCYIISVVTLTDGGKPLNWAHRHSMVPGAN
jgi:hypothetical protein